jgi:lysophospholipase L1-like esterase
VRDHRDALLACALVWLVVCVGAVRTVALYENSLALHPAWVSTKTTLGRGVMGAVAFATGQQALARNRLNLGAWFGFQEVLSRDALELTRLELRFRVEPEGYLHVLYDHRRGGFAGLRLGSRADAPSLHYRATPDGGFIAAEPLGAAPVAPGAWHHVALAFDGERVTASLDGVPLGAFARSAGLQRVGFRGGQRRAEVDDVLLEATGGDVRREGFENRARRGRRLGLALAALLALGTSAGAAALRSPRPLRPRILGAAAAGAVLGVVVAAAYAFQWVRGADYAATRADLAGAERYWIDATRREVLAAIRARYEAAVPPDTFRLLVLGTSQTWGAGATSEEETWVRRLERLLAQDAGGRRVECVNAGVSGLQAEQVAGLLRRGLAGLEASAALVNLSNNDIDPAAFERGLEAIAAELDRRGIPAVFALEPNATERRASDSPHGDLAAKHAVVREVAARHGSPVVDLHAYLASQRDAGLLWWDFVHLTGFGQRLVAERLAGELPALFGWPAGVGAAAPARGR